MIEAAFQLQVMILAIDAIDGHGPRNQMHLQLLPNKTICCISHLYNSKSCFVHY